MSNDDRRVIEDYLPIEAIERILIICAAPLTISISKSRGPAERDSAPPFEAATVA